MASNNDEDERLRSVALQNFQSIFRTRFRADDELRKQSDWLRVTLSSIGDAVISTDVEGRVNFLNGVAESLTGWSQAEAQGHLLPDVFQIVNEQTRQPVDNPALRALREGIIVGLANHTVLIAKDGRELPIDDSAAPIRSPEGEIVGSVLIFRDTTERRRAEKALRESEAQLTAELRAMQQLQEISSRLIQEGDISLMYHEILDAAMVLMGSDMASMQMIDEDQDGLRMLAWRGFSAEFDQIFGLNRSDRKTSCSIARQTGHRVVVPDVETCDFIVGTTALEDHRKTGIRAVQSTPLFSRDGRMLGIISTHWRQPHQPAERELRLLDVLARQAADLIERRQSEQALHESAARKTAMFESALDCIISIDHEGKIIEFNAAAEHTFGHRREDVLGQELAQVIIPPAYREHHRKGLGHYLATGEGPILNQRLELPALRADGTEFPLELTVTRIPAVEPVLFSAYLRDITERKQAEEALSRLAAIIESSDDAIVSKGLDGVITSWNRSAEKMFGYTAEEAVGQHISFIIPVERLSEEDEVLSRLRRGEKVDHFETERQTKDGRRINISLTVSPVKDKAGRIIGASKVARDITERIRAEHELHQFAAKLTEADHRKDEFLAMLAHELRNPLAPIRNAVQVLRLTSGKDQTVQSASEMMERQLGQMVRLVDDLLDVSRISRGKIELRKERIELASIVHHAVEACQSLYSSMNHELTVMLPSEPIYLNADPTRLAQVIGNLLNNACKFTDKGGRIWLTVEVVSGGRQPSGEAVIRVRDSGIGIAADQLPRIFEMFVQVDTSLERSVSGLGIGLTLVKNLVEMHDGTVAVQSAGIGHGSEFEVRLPIMADTPKPRPPEPIVRKPSSAMARRILVVDDNRDSATTLAMLLKLTGNETHTVHDGLAAVEAAATFKPDVVLLDIGLPKLNGFEAARKIREQPWGKSIVLVALTGWGQADDRRKSSEAGFNGHMVKPVDHATLMKLLGELLPTFDRSKNDPIKS